MTGSKPSPDSPYDPLEGGGHYRIDVAGESHHQATLKAVAGPKHYEGKSYECTASLCLEDDNRFDSNAVRVEILGQTVGYLHRDDAVKYRRALSECGKGRGTYAAKALIVGGWKNRETEGSYGVRLDLRLGRRSPRRARAATANQLPYSPSHADSSGQQGNRKVLLGLVMLIGLAWLAYLLRACTV